MRIDQSKQNISPSTIFSWPMTTSLNDAWDRSYFGDNLGESVYTVTPRDDDAPPPFARTGARCRRRCGGSR